MLIFSDVRFTTVRSLHKTAHVKNIDPIFCDLNLADAYMPNFFTYRLPDKSEAVYSQEVKGIKESLQKVLVSFFAFAGRWCAVPPGSSSRKLLCNDEGVPFVEAYVDSDLDSVVEASAAFQPVPDLQGWKFVGMDEEKRKQEMQPDGLPPIFVQITRFACGGLVLAATFNHATTDGKGFFSFLKAWSDLSRTDETSVKVDHNRAQIEMPAIRDFLSKLQIGRMSISGDQSGGHDTVPEVSPWVLKLFEVSASTIKALKQEAKDGGQWVSTGDCVAAHIWKCLAGLPSSLLRGRELNFSFAVEGRTRFYDPPLPDLFANVLTIMPGREIIASNDVLDMPLVSVARRLRDKVESTPREDWVTLEGTIRKIQAYDSRKSASWTFTSGYSFPQYELDFGFGKPFFCSGPNRISSFDGQLGSAVLAPPIPSNPSSSVTLYIWSKPEVLRALQESPNFSTIFLEQ